MKDFYDVWVLSKTQEFKDDRLPRAIAATFKRRDTPIPEGIPDALTSEFARDENKRQQWAAFTRDLSADARNFDTVIAELAAFLVPTSGVARRLPSS